MKVFAISDLHLSINNPKPMDIFGPVWDGYLETIEQDWKEKVSQDDIVLIPGDISWAMRLAEAEADLNLLCGFEGNKFIIKGNHDYWWGSIGEVRKRLTNNTNAIQNDAFKVGNYIICGSRGWIIPDNGIREPQDEKIYKRELIRMELSLKTMDTLRTNGEKVVVMTHFPPFNSRVEDSEMVELFKKYNVDAVVYGHLHSYYKKQKKVLEKDGIKYYLTSCDLVGNRLVEIDL
jgi:predicted phosphohydrolase